MVVYYALRDHHRAASFARMSSQCKWHTRALVWSSPQNTKSVLCQKTLLCFHLLGLFICIGEKLLFQGYIHESFLIIGDYKKIWNRAKIFFLFDLSIAPTTSQNCRPSHLPYDPTKELKHTDSSVIFFPPASLHDKIKKLTRPNTIWNFNSEFC